ncbi:MAG TPA: hypothetical protein VN886_19270 [Acidimicrobiales bacterium]|nr:hypothetical protein [Acidimicrobiales bacterium]
MNTILTAPDDATRTQLLMLAEIIKLVSRAGDLARLDIANPPPATAHGIGTWTRVTGALVELEAMIAVYRQLGGPDLPANVESFARDLRRMDTKPAQVVGESVSVLGQLQNVAENFPARANKLGMATVSGQTRRAASGAPG